MASKEEFPSKPLLHTNNLTSLLDLKTEFLKRKKAATLEIKTNKDGLINPTKNNILAISKEEKRIKEEQKLQRNTRILRNEELIRKEEQEYLQRKKILEQKAAIYDKITNDGALIYVDGKEAEFLVNFEEKRRELEAVAETKASGSSKYDDYYSDEEDSRNRVKETPLIVHYNPMEG